MITLRRTLAAVAGAALFALPAAAQAQAQGTPPDTRPTVAVIDFTNSAVGKLNADMEPLRAGIAGMLITELAGNEGIRVVERQQLQAVLAELQLGQSQNVDPQAAVRIGKLLNAHHIVTGGFITDSRGRLVLTARSIETETGRIEYSSRVNGKTDDVLDVVEKLAKQVNTGLKLPALQLRVREASNTPSRSSTGSGSAGSAAAAPARRQAVPFQAVMLYSRALQALDKQEKGEAVQLFRASLDKFPDYEAAKQQLARLQPGA